MSQVYKITIDMQLSDSVAEIGRIIMEADEVGWFVKFGVERGADETGLYSRSFGHSEVEGKNILGVLAYALLLLSDNPNAMGAPSGTDPSDVARRLRRTLPEIQARKG